MVREYDIYFHLAYISLHFPNLKEPSPAGEIERVHFDTRKLQFCLNEIRSRATLLEIADDYVYSTTVQITSKSYRTLHWAAPAEVRQEY